MHSFVPLDVWLRGASPAPPTEPVAAPATPVAVPDEPPEHAPETDAAAADARRFRAALADALDAALAALVRDIATEILGRELVLAPTAIAAIVREATARVPEIVRVRVHPREVAALRAVGACAVADATLLPGDALIEVADGMHDATLGARFRSVLAAWTVA